MCLWIEENFGVKDILRMYFLQVCPRQIVKILFFNQHIGAAVINIQKLLKVVEIVGSIQLVQRTVLQLQVVPDGNFKHQFRFESSLDMQMKFRFWNFSDE